MARPRKYAEKTSKILQVPLTPTQLEAVHDASNGNMAAWVRNLILAALGQNTPPDTVQHTAPQPPAPKAVVKQLCSKCFRLGPVKNCPNCT